jgi:hypothetical protein
MIGPVAPVDAGGSLRGGRGKAWQRAAMLAMLTAMLTAWAMPAAGTTAARDPEPPLRIPLEPIGYQPLLPEFLLAGSPMLTVDFVDNDHLLITFGVRRLMTREPDPPADDDDRTIGAFLVELPSGKVLAQTEWREHDRWRYLWNLGHGRFLLRVRDNLTLLAPMEASDPANAFRQTPLLRIERHIVQVLVSWNSDLLTVETVLRAARTGEAEDENGGPLIPGDPAPVQLNFYRLVSEGGPAGKLVAVAAGAIRAHTTGTLPLTAVGFLDELEGGKGSWMFNFDEHAGKVHELAEWDTSCFPRANFVGPGEFVAFGCRGSDDSHMFAGFNLKGELMWQQNFVQSYVSPTFAFAPAAGRFALGRTMVSNETVADSMLASSVVTGQVVQVYQSYNGKQLFRMDCSPVERAGQNFALSDDGLRLAVVRESMVHHAATKDYDAYTERSTAVEVYPLPPLADKDRAAVKAAQAGAPADSGARIDVSLARSSAPTDATAAAGTANGASGPAPAQTQAPDAGQQAAPAAAGTEAASDGGGAGGTGNSGGTAAGNAEGTAAGDVGDVAPAGPRKPPTLYGPGEGPGEGPGQTPPEKKPE